MSPAPTDNYLAQALAVPTPSSNLGQMPTPGLVSDGQGLPTATAGKVRSPEKRVWQVGNDWCN